MAARGCVWIVMKPLNQLQGPPLLWAGQVSLSPGRFLHKFFSAQNGIYGFETQFGCSHASCAVHWYFDGVRSTNAQCESRSHAIIESAPNPGCQVVVLSPSCTMFSQTMRINFGKMKKDDLKKRWQDAMCFLNFTVEIIHYVLHIGGFLFLNTPLVLQAGRSAVSRSYS